VPGAEGFGTRISFLFIFSLHGDLPAVLPKFQTSIKWVHIGEKGVIIQEIKRTLEKILFLDSCKMHDENPALCKILPPACASSPLLSSINLILLNNSSLASVLQLFKPGTTGMTLAAFIQALPLPVG
jgi:hypothetical protein